MLFPQNIDGETWGNDEYGLPVPTKAAGYEVVVPGYFQPRTNDFSAQIAEFKAGNCEIIGGITYPDDLKTFVTQCNQQGFKPKAVTVAAALFSRAASKRWATRQRHVLGSLVDAGLPVQVVADRAGQQRHRQPMGSRAEAAVDAAARLFACRWRSCSTS